LGMMLIVLGMPLSRAMLSIGMILLTLVALLQIDFTEKIKRFYSVTPFIAIHAFFFLIVLSGLWSDETTFWIERVRIKLPFLFLPVAFYILMPIERKAFLLLLKTYFWLILLCCIWSLLHLFADFKNIAVSYASGSVMFTPVNHIRFSLMTVMAAVIGLELLSEKYGAVWKKGIVIAAVIIMIVYLHLLAVRSGLLALYMVSLVLLVKYILQSRKYWVAVVAVVLITTTPFVALRFFPTLENKFHYMRYDLQNYFSGNYEIFGSDTRRLLSFRAGIEAGNEKPLLGHGYGDIKKAVADSFQKKFNTVPETNRLMPHNQFIFIYVGLGIVGLLIFLYSFFIPLFYNRNWNNTILLSLTVMVFTSFLSEYTLETQIGVAFYLFFLLPSFCLETNRDSKMKRA
jgi:O-antigen ligase